MRVVTWNVDRATYCRNTQLSAAKWKAFLRMSADIAMLQEVYNIPQCVRDRYHVEYVKTRYFTGGCARFGSAVLARKPDWKIGAEATWRSGHDWVNRIQQTFPGWLVGRQVESASGDRCTAVSVHAPAFPVERWEGAHALCEILDGVDVAPVKLQNNPTLYFTEILWSLLKGATIDKAASWIVAGDFNSSILFDKPKDKGNGEIVERFNALGLFDCAFKRHGERKPTYRAKTHRHLLPVHQLDYVYANAPLLDRLTDVAVGGDLPAGEKWLSDHLPVVCDFGAS